MKYTNELVNDLRLYRKLYMQEREKNEGYVILLNELENKLNHTSKINIELYEQLKEIRKYKKMFFEQKKLVMKLSNKL